jgi:CRISPR-associated protein Cas7/Cst2/DevR subtype I-B
MENNNGNIPNITVTMIFEGSALNRNEKIGTNILSIKKLIVNGDERPFISKGAIRHYLFNTLVNAFNWKETPILTQGSGEKQTIQFNLEESDIVDSPELAFFGYMFTKEGGALTRKSPIGITKAFGLFPYEQDIAFYANHDMVRRGRNMGQSINPNPYSKEEFTGLFKVSFTIDTNKISTDSWIIDDYTYDESKKLLSLLVQTPQKFVFGNVTERTDDEDNHLYYEIEEKTNKYQIKINNSEVEIPMKLVSKSGDKISLISDFANDVIQAKEKGKENKPKTKYSLKMNEFDEEPKSNTIKFVLSNSPEETFNKEEKTIEFQSGHQRELKVNSASYSGKSSQNTFEFNGGKIKVYPIKEGSEKGPFWVKFEMKPALSKKFVNQFLSTLKNGLYAQSSGEANTIVPLFMIASAVKVPSPVFHSYIEINKENRDYKVIGLSDCFKNGWVNGNIFIYNSERFKVVIPDKSNVEKDWTSFLDSLNLKVEKEKK